MENDEVLEEATEDSFGTSAAKFVLGTLAGAAAAKLVENLIDAFVEHRRSNAATPQ